MEDKEIKEIVKERYSRIAEESTSCCPTCGPCGHDVTAQAKGIGYSEEELEKIPKEAIMGLGCGNPTALGDLKEGETVLDLGAGAGIDVFLAANKVGPDGYVIGVDMTEEMAKKASETAAKCGYKNVEFRLGEIENLPVENNSVDVLISNCVINLAPDKSKVFSEGYRVLKKGGKMYLSDIVLLKELSFEQKNDATLLAGCVAGASLKDDYLKKIEEAGLNVRIISEDKDISKTQYQGIALESLNIEASK